MDGCSADWVLVPARTRDGLQTFLVEDAGEHAQPAPSLDVTRKFARFEFDQTPARSSSGRRATTRTSGAGSPTTPRCCSRPSSSA